ncbi:flavin reductase like domain-containing protein [Mycena leptocephala]|nr:flavin reductase like domain-containing protein [Mycena leptocephala]
MPNLFRHLLTRSCSTSSAAAGRPPKPTEREYHGATLSSFTSISMDPPLVSFALRIPSRMAASLNSSPSDSPSDMASIATKFSRPDLHPRPFSETPYFLNTDGIPVIRGSLGAISCKLVAKGLPLHDLRFLQPRHVDETPSKLFIAEVTHVEELEISGDELPLLYHQRRFTTCIPDDISTARPP